MPFHIRTTQGPLVEYLSKTGGWTPDVKKARIYVGLGPVKTSLGHLDDEEARHVQVVELVLQETGKTWSLEEVLAPMKARRRTEQAQRDAAKKLAERNRELAELARLSTKYTGYVNQCDGCQAGIPVENGKHRMGAKEGYPNWQSCQAAKYSGATP